jgi:eukaryotic-like serine/threonine-protein kinase
VLRDLRVAPDFAALAARLRPLVNLIPDVSRRRRFGLVVGCVAPALVFGVFSFVGVRMLQVWRQQYPDLMPLVEALVMRDRMSHGKFPPGVDPKIGVGPVEIYIAGRFGNFIRDPKARSLLVVRSIISPPLRAEADRIAAAHPNPTAAEMESARAALARVIDSKGNLSSTPGDELEDITVWKMYWIGSAEVLVCAAVFSVAAALLFRGGLLLRALGIAVVRRDGADASRGRMLWRACVAWSWLPLGISACSMLKLLTGWPAATAIVGLLVLGAVVWSAARLGRSLQDRLAGTWLVPR